MFSIFETTDNLVENGAIVKVQILSSSQLPFDTYAEINTVSEVSCIQEGVATSLGLEPISAIKIMTPNHLAYETYLYDIRLVFPQHNLIFPVYVYEVPYVPRAGSQVKCLIGRDILQHTVLTYNGWNNSFKLEFKG
jgi:hypothetical protein